MDFSRDELRRERREIERLQAGAERDQATVLRAVLEDVPAEHRSGVLLSGVDRRGLFRMGGLAVAATAVMAACREKGPKEQLPISGTSPGFTKAPDLPVTDIVLLRTASSLERSVMDAYQKILQNGWVEDPEIAALIQVFHDHHWSHAETIEAVTAELGGTPCATLNPKITADLLDPLLVTISTAGGNRGEDAKAFAHALENLAGATYQAFVPELTRPALRRAAMSLGAVEARHAAVLAALLNPDVLVGSVVVPTPDEPATPTVTTVPSGVPDAPGATTTTTTIVETAVASNSINAIPSAFGSLAPVVLTVGSSGEGGTRRTQNLETPSLNSYLYESETC